MNLTGLHLLLTYQCTFECDHCFVWGSPWQIGTMTINQIRQILEQARDTGSIEDIYFEGGEPFLYYAVLLKGVQEAAGMGFKVGIVSNAYWANSHEDAVAFLSPLSEFISDLTISNDLYHYSEQMSHQAMHATSAAEELGIPVSVICVAQPEQGEASSSLGQLTDGSAVMVRGRAASKLTNRLTPRRWDLFNSYPHEDLRNPGRVHFDPLGYVHICQGISIGNIFELPIRELCDKYVPESHPICGPLLAGGPMALVTGFGLSHSEKYADACHLCYESRLALRSRFPEILTPDQMYGIGL